MPETSEGRVPGQDERTDSRRLRLMPASRLMCFAGMVLLNLLSTPAWAVNELTPATVAVAARHESLEVHAPYADDGNGNGTLRISWARSGTDWLDESVATVDIDHQVGAFDYVIANLENYLSYQVKVEFLDADGLTNALGVQVIPGITPFNRILHNSMSTGSLKWSAQGGWGVPGAKYGEFGCATCHGRGTDNIKRIRNKVAVTDPLCADQFPLQQADGTITFLTAVSDNADFGDDQRVPPESSTNICESCHSQNKFHNYNALNNTGGTSHYNRAVCITCHPHQEGFKPRCGGCHPEIPSAGSHARHYNSQMLGQELSCSTCHATAVHRNILSEVRFDPSRPAVAAGTYSDQGGDESSCYSEADGYCAGPVYGSCDNLYCHSNANPLSGSNAYAQPVWGGAPLGCSSCHSPTGGSQALSAPHGRHTAAAAYAYPCEKCHKDTVSGSDTVIAKALHINLVKDVALTGAGTYSATTNECATVYCHSDGRAGAATSPSCLAVAVSCHYTDLDADGTRETSLGDQTTSLPKIPRWTDPGGYDCSACHKGRTGANPRNAQMDSSGHFRLANEHWIRQYKCSYCHYQTVDGNGVLKFADNTHVNETVDIAFDPKWKIAGYPEPSYNPDTMVCNNLYCHSDGTSTPKVRDFPWNYGQHAKCDSCHGHEPGADCATCHTAGVPEVSPENQWKMSMPMYENTGAGTARANSHLRHLETEFACENCHRDTVVGSCNSIGCHDGVVPDGKMSEVGHVFANFHVNTIRDVAFKDGGGYIRATQTCTNTACHNNSEPRWGESRSGAILCLTCHGTTEDDVDDYGAFNNVQARINMNEWANSGHGRMTASGNYPSDNPPANFPGNPCWYCHDSEILHDNATNPYRLKEHPQFQKRFEKECVYCHMERKDEECWGCHDHSGNFSTEHQLVNLTGTDPDDNLPYTVDHAPFAGQNVTCLTSNCHLPQSETQCRNCHDNPADTSGAVQLTDAVLRKKPDDTTYRVSEIRVGMRETPYAIDHLEFRSTGSKGAVSCMATAQEWAPNGCHSADVHIHNAGAGTWTSTQKEDVRNQYVMMGVCLQCHDNDDNNRCSTCHEWTGAPEANPFRLGYDPGTGFHTGSSKASSTHFGFKHFKDYEESLTVVAFTSALSKVSQAHKKYAATLLTDASKSWAADELVGKTLQFTSGPLTGETRPILINTANTITLKGLFPEPVAEGTTYKVLNTVWRGGKFCWDCHDPHGDSNIYMIQKEIAVKTDGLFGKPLQRAPTVFTRTTSGRDYAKDAAPYNGICNVCHTDVDHYLSNSGDTHRSGRRCTTCHNHGFDEGHGSGKSCGTCHDQKPVPNHLGFGQPRDCTKCHDGVINQRTDIMRQFRGQSHHVQGVAVSNEHCYQCHWEATKDGLIDNDYHAGYNYKTHETIIGSKNDMVVWGAQGRPSKYDLDNTAVIFNTASIGTTAERENVTRVTQHCLGCHSKQHDDTDVFGDCKTPRQYAWDRTSIAERYLDEGTVNWGKYSGVAKAAKKIQQKAFSAHGKATLNQGGWSVTDGEDGTLPNTRAGTQNVQCYDCHNSHGSYTAGITSSYLTFNNTYGGANLKETQAGKGGYTVTYQAKAITDGAGTVNPMNPGAAQCFDCHETRDAGAKPWGYFSTFGADKPIQSYRDSSRFGGGTTGHKGRFAYRAGMNTLGGHLKASASLVTPATQPINGLCSGCHDPHGVSPSLGADQAYGVPLLKGTWLTSPYKDDKPQVTANQRSSSFVYTDRTTFGTTNGTSQGPPVTIGEDAEKFAGLCLRCHPKSSLTNGTNQGWKTKNRIHETVKGWGSTEHSYPCAKCHNAHSSGLGRLMRTNCLEVKHRGEGPSGGTPGYYSTAAGMAYPRTAYYYGGSGWLPACHESSSAGGGAWNQQEWNTVTPW